MEICGERKGKGCGNLRSLREEQDCLKEESLVRGDSVKKSLVVYFLVLVNLTANCGGQARGVSLGVSVGHSGLWEW